MLINRNGRNQHMKKKILILSGPTYEYIDPVRFIGNASSGKMGCAIAKEAIQRGFDVDFITGPVEKENLPPLSRIYSVISANEMLTQAKSLFDSANIIIFVAAVSDYMPAKKQREKIPKSTEDFILHLKPTPDISKILSTQKRSDQITIGFALQTDHPEENAKRKLQEKKLDGIILNTPDSLSSDSGTFSYLSATSSNFEKWGFLTKQSCARHILNLFS